MSDWYWKIIALKAAFVLTCFASSLRADDNVQKLPFCNPSNLREGPVYNDLMIVSTLDGKLTAFSTQNGIKAWEVESQPLLSSNLHNVELTSGGKWVRLVPSLRGALYSLSGDTIEPLPFDAEQLLSSSYKYSDDLVIAGARETVWLGIDANSGNVIYECSSSGCNSEQAATSGARDVIVLRRHSNTVRALDPRAGSEKWNFSVAEHQLALNRGECIGGAAPGPPASVAVAVALHDGRVALRTGDSQLLWQHKLDAPVAGMWRLQGSALQTMDVVWEATQTLTQGVTQHPSLYIGVHNTQLYIQESTFYTRKLETGVSTNKAPWKLVSGRPMLESDTALTPVNNEHALSQVSLYGSKGLIGDYGFFLYMQETCDQSVQASPDDIDAAEPESNASDDAHEHHHIHVHVYSLWFWWKEVLLIAVSSALLMNLMIWPRFFAPKPPALSLSKTQGFTKSDLVTHYERIPNQLQATHRVAMTHINALPPPPIERPVSVPEYSGRYETDFTPLRCLGKGGFGVVFEVRNNIDHCCYALKRITLPQKESRRERVRREVRALAKLEHVNIVRYFNAWEERPPPEQQQLRDIALIRELESASALSEGYSSSPMSTRSPAKSPPNAKGDSVILNLQKPFDSDALDYRLQLPSKRNRYDKTPYIHQVGRRRRPPDGKRSLPTVLDDVTVDVAAKHIPSLSCSDSIVFDSNATGGAGDHSTGHGHEGHMTSTPNRSQGHVTSPSSDAKHNSIDKRLSMVQESEYKTDSSISKKKKKGHTRHWSLDACVKSESEGVAASVVPLYLYIQMQLCRRDSLHDWLRENRTPQRRKYDEIKSLFSQIVSAVDYVHKAGLIHRDLKPSNILFSPDGTVKVGDFGLVTSMGDTSQDGERFEETDAYQPHTYRVGTHLYMSPEQVQCRPYSYKVDIYSLGLILFELLQPFGTESERVRCLQDLRQGRYPQDFRHKYTSETEALELMLSPDPSKRPTAIGVRARAPLCETTDERYHFTLPPIAAA